MRLRPSRPFRFIVVAVIALQWTLPALAAVPATVPAWSTVLLPAWYTVGDRMTNWPTGSTALLPGWSTGANHLIAPDATALSIAKSAAPDAVDHGDLLTYVIAVTNETGKEAQQVMVTDTTPAGTILEAARVREDGGATWFLGGLSPGQSGDFTWLTGDWVGVGSGLPGNRTAVLELVVRVVGPFADDEGVHNSHYCAKAENALGACGPDVTTVVNASAAPLTLPTPATAMLPAGDTADSAVAATQSSTTTLSITKIDAPDPVDQNHLLTYLITVTNNTAPEAEQAVVTETTPVGTVFESARVLDGGGATWFGGGLSPGESGDHIWFTGDRVGIGGGLPGNQAAVFEFVVKAVGPFPDQDPVRNDHYLADAENADLAEGDEVTTTVNAPAFALGKASSSDPITAGERLTYTIYLTNTGHLTTSYPYTIVETLPAFASFAHSDPPAEQSGGTLTWTLTTPMGIGQAVSVTFAVTVETPYTTGLPLVNDTYVAPSDEVTPTAHGPAITTTVLSWPALSISKVVDSDPVEAGAFLTYTLVVTNASSALAPAEGTFVTDTLPSYVGDISCQPSPCGPTGGQTISWTLGTLWPGQTRHLTITARVYRPLASGAVLTNYAGISSTNALSAVRTSTETTVDSAPVLIITKSVTPSAVTAGRTITYTIVVTNTGNETASGAIITDTLPTSFQFGGMLQGDAPSVSGNVLTWANQTITPTAGLVWPTGWISPSGPLMLVFTATAGGISNTYYNAVTVTRGPVSASTGPTAAVFVGTPDLRLHKSGDPDPVEPGQLLTYTLVYSNASSVPATGVVITDTLPGLITGGYANPSPDEGTIGAHQTITWNVGALESSMGNQTIRLVVTLTLPITDGQVLTNTARITCIEGSTASTGPVTTTVESSPDVLLVKSATPPSVSPNDLVTYTLVFSNVGTAAATGTVTDSLPISLTQIVSTTTPNVSFVTSTHPVYTWTVSALAPSQQGTITITGRVITTTYWGQSTRITNTAGITAPGDSFVGDNTGYAAVDVVPGPPAAITLTPAPPATTVDCSSAVTAEVRDVWGNAVSDGAEITFTTSTATSGASPPTGFTSLGYVTTTITSTLPGSVVITATASSMISGTTSVDFSAGAPHTFGFAPVADPQTAGVSFTVILTAYDQHGNVATGYGGTAGLSDDTATLSPTVSHSAIGGVLTQSVAITRAWVNNVISASAGGTTSCGDPWSAAGSSGPFTVVHNLALTLTLAPQDETVAAGNTVGYTADATDTYGNNWTATSEVTFTTSSGNAFLGIPPGNHVFSATTAGVDLPVTGTIAGVGGPVIATTGITVTHGDPVSLTISPRDVVTVAGNWVTYTAVATDAFGNGWDATAQTSWTAGGGNVFSGNVLSATVAGTWPVTGAVPGASDSTAITVTPGPVMSLDMAPVGDPQTAGIGFGVVITGYDAFHNVATDFSGGLNLTDTTGTITPTTASMSNGVASEAVTITLAWVSDRITATLSATPTIFTVSDPFTVVGGLPATLVYTTPASLRLCEHTRVTATVTDLYGNPVADGTVVTLTCDSSRMSFLESGAWAYYPTTSGGVATGTLVAGSNATPPAIGWTQAQAGSASPTLHWVTIITPGVPYSMTIVAVPDTIDVFSGTATITATVYDCAAVPNRVSGETVTFVASFGTVNPPSDVTDGSGEATTAFSSTLAGIAVITAAAGQASGSVQVTVEPPGREVYLPLVLGSYQGIGINLVVDSIVWEPTSPISGQSVTISVTVRNLGPFAAGSFWVDLYVDPSATPQPGVLWSDVCTKGLAWKVPGLTGGQALTLRFGGQYYEKDHSNWNESLANTPNPHELWAVVDSWLGQPTVVEDREDDNVLGPEYVFMSGGP